MGTLSKEWAISMAFSIALLLVFGLGLVWLNIERVDMAYELNKIQRQIDEMETLSAKLEVERNTLITPSRLRELAKDCGLGSAKPGQIRRVAATGEVEASPLVSLAAEPGKGAGKVAGDTAVAKNPGKSAGRATGKGAAKVAADAGEVKGGESNAVNAAIARAATPKPLKTTAAEQQ
ncbi:hypothetical protein [Solidesulfovibrio aerotolerans]|uniref:hypothetical protein n=1 Tax=Solidesulfovibrio aerotolerans TaxID=295255 RepID=UPI001FEC2937|nr:hypothetical protein [Solidesulfovibrio aerotolerans]